MTAEDRPPFVRHLRVAAVLVVDGHVLLHRAEWEWFWSLPGGRLEPMELSRPALRRELAEEIGADVEVGRLIWIVENLFTLDGTDYQEVGFYYECTAAAGPAGDHSVGQFDGAEPDVRLIYRWFPLDELDHVPLFPEFLRSGLQDVPAMLTHVVDATDLPPRP